MEMAPVSSANDDTEMVTGTQALAAAQHVHYGGIFAIVAFSHGCDVIADRNNLSAVLSRLTV